MPLQAIEIAQKRSGNGAPLEPGERPRTKRPESPWELQVGWKCCCELLKSLETGTEEWRAAGPAARDGTDGAFSGGMGPLIPEVGKGSGMLRHFSSDGVHIAYIDVPR